MNLQDVVCIDFETESIQRRPVYPPVPVGVSVKFPGRVPVYFAWGHPSHNNCDRNTARKIIRDIFAGDAPLLFHNAKFDVDVATTAFGLPMPSWERMHDTLYLVFLADPYAHSFALKPSAERWLDMPPTEQEAVRQWLIDNKIVKSNDKKWGAHIAKAPGNLVGKYAKGDVDRTLKLFKNLYPLIAKRGMAEAYDRERQLMPILLENERIGMRVDHGALGYDIVGYTTAMEQVEHYLRRKLKSPELNFDADAEVAEALVRNDSITHWEKTKTGKRSVAKKHLTRDRYTDPKLFMALGYRNRLSLCLNTFMKPWLEMADSSNGYIFTNWNQVKNTSAYGDAGAKTGRMSTNPNFQNLPKNFYDKGDGYEHPKFIRLLPELPICRRYIIADPGHILGHRDYNQQELRILAHYEDADLCAEYCANPALDVHSYVRDKIAQVSGIEYERRFIKTMNFGMLYGMGIKRLAETLGIDYDEAKAMKQAQRAAMHNLVELENDLREKAAHDIPFRTWGGRSYFCEPAKEVEGEMRSYEYKMLNYLIQGSAADCTKQAIINYHALKKDGRFLVTVHDEINISVPKKALKSEMALLKEAMEGVKFDVPMMTDAKYGSNWANLEKL